eukprot:NODE_56_length_25944_cov_0.235287.p16 type:complete len:129 gc:universal NODE_56_length_25944_cov_0.235287:18157-18543(+)
MLLAIIAAVFASLSSCSDKGSFEIESLRFEDIVKPNVPAMVEMDGIANKQVTSGKVEIVAKYGIFEIFSDIQDICSLLTCPAIGPSTVNKEFTIPGTAPGGGYSIKLEGTDQDGDLVFCISGKFSLKK